jgi:hypothetical protein
MSGFKGLILLAVVLGVAVLCGLAVLTFFWSIWIEKEGHSDGPDLDDETDSSASTSGPSFLQQSIHWKMVRWIWPQMRMAQGKANVNGAEAA